MMMMIEMMISTFNKLGSGAVNVNFGDYGVVVSALYNNNRLAAVNGGGVELVVSHTEPC